MKTVNQTRAEIQRLLEELAATHGLFVHNIRVEWSPERDPPMIMSVKVDTELPQ